MCKICGFPIDIGDSYFPKSDTLYTTHLRCGVSYKPTMEKKVRVFETGATRDRDEDKFDYEGFLSPLVLERFAAYMHSHRIQADGKLRSSDNWAKGIPLDAYMKSGWRHFMDWWMGHRGLKSEAVTEDALCAMLFNVQGYLHEMLKARGA